MVANNWWYICVAEGCVLHSAKELQKIHSHNTGTEPGRSTATNRDGGSKGGGRELIKFPRVDLHCDYGLNIKLTSSISKCSCNALYVPSTLLRNIERIRVGSKSPVHSGRLAGCSEAIPR